MALRTFKGGIHPNDGKELAKDKPLSELSPGKELVFPLSMHIGAPAKPVVEKGDRVLVGQMIAEPGGFVSAAIHASVSGTVKAIEPHVTAVGSSVNSIVITNDEQYEMVETAPQTDYTTLSKEEILEKIRMAGIVGMGGAGFPTQVKLSPKEPEKIEYVIANCAECEPYITADYRRMMENGEELIEGLKVILRLFDNATGILAIEDNKPDCIENLTKLANGENRIKVMPLQTKYPQGAERNLIFATTGRKINSSMLPADAGCVVDNVETIIAIKRAVIDGKPLISRTITVSGDAAKTPGNFIVPVGMNQLEVIEAAGGFSEDLQKIISGGPMMGFAMYTADCPVTKTTSAILGFREDAVSNSKQTQCINCGRCVSVCPEHLVPTRLSKYAVSGRLDLFEKWHGVECVECGSCSYVCPAKRPLKQEIGTMRKIALANRKKAAAKK